MKELLEHLKTHYSFLYETIGREFESESDKIEFICEQTGYLKCIVEIQEFLIKNNKWREC